MHLIDELELEMGKDRLPSVHVGDTVEVHYLITEGDKERIHEVGPPRRAMQRVVAAVRPSCYRRHGRCLTAIGSQVLHPPDKAEHHVTPGEGPKSGEEYIELFRQQKS